MAKKQAEKKSTDKKPADNKKAKGAKTEDPEEGSGKASHFTIALPVDIALTSVAGEGLEGRYRGQRATYFVREAFKSYRSLAENSGKPTSSCSWSRQNVVPQEGVSFNKVAQEYSEDKAKGNSASVCMVCLCRITAFYSWWQPRLDGARLYGR